MIEFRQLSDLDLMRVVRESKDADIDRAKNAFAISSDHYSFTPPSISPDTKYRCTKGYTASTGSMPSTMTAILVLS